jgi:hypothetical protein
VGVYSVAKLIGEARRLASEYRRATGKSLGGVSVEIAQFDAAQHLDLELQGPDARGFDAVGRSGPWAGKRIQIKGRAIFDERKPGQRIGQLKIDQEWDSVVLVLMDADYQAYAIYEAEREDLLEALSDTDASRRARRGALSVAKFKNIGRLVWSRESGVIADEVWDNMAGT